MRLGCLRQRADFDALLARRPLLRSAHFAVHHAPNTIGKAVLPAVSNLSTGPAQELATSVDKSTGQSHRLGCMIPKRLVRRAVTRNLIRREIRSRLSVSLSTVEPGRWLVRVIQPWPVSAWPSATSRALAAVVRTELAGLFSKLKPAAR